MYGCDSYQQILPNIFYQFSTFLLYVKDEKNNKKTVILNNVFNISSATLNKQLSVDSYLIVFTYQTGTIRYYRFSQTSLKFKPLKQVLFQLKDWQQYCTSGTQEFYMTKDLIFVIKNGKILKKINQNKLRYMPKQYQIQILLKLNPQKILQYPFDKISPYHYIFKTIQRKLETTEQILSQHKIEVINDYLVILQQQEIEQQIYFIECQNLQQQNQNTEWPVHKIKFKKGQKFMDISHYNQYIFVLIMNNDQYQIFQINGTYKLEQLVYSKSYSSLIKWIRLSTNYMIWEDIEDFLKKNYKITDNNDILKYLTII